MAWHLKVSQTRLRNNKGDQKMSQLLRHIPWRNPCKLHRYLFLKSRRSLFAIAGNLEKKLIAFTLMLKVAQLHLCRRATDSFFTYSAAFTLAATSAGTHCIQRSSCASMKCAAASGPSACSVSMNTSMLPITPPGQILFAK